MDAYAEGVACHCCENHEATSACVPESQGSRRMLKKRRDGRGVGEEEVDELEEEE
jgi:hypothetical protein